MTNFITLKLSNEKAEAFGIKTVADLETKLAAHAELDAKVKSLETDLQKHQTADASVSTPAAESVSDPKDESKAAEQAAPAAEDKPEDSAAVAPAAETVAETETLKKDIAELKANQSKAIALAVADAFAAIGSPVPLAVDNSVRVTSKSRDELFAELNAIEDSAKRAEFYETNRKALLGK